MEVDSSRKSGGIIRRLPDEVVNRIAAGEVIQRPTNVVKELLENSIDSGATQITITVKNGGLKHIQIQDNGEGIARDDLPILCHRFTTSKLREFSDLQRIRTYGFRGEALAAVSHVARLAVLSRTPHTPCAFKALYSDGKLVEEPSVEIPPDQIDVNVHPTKQEVKFLHETRMLERLVEAIEAELLAYKRSHPFPWSGGPHDPAIHPSLPYKNPQPKKPTSQDSKRATDGPLKKVYDHHLVRTDNREQKLDPFLLSGTKKPPGENPGISSTSQVKGGSHQGSSGLPPAPPLTHKASAEPEVIEEVYASQNLKRVFELESLKILRRGVVREASKFLREVMRDHSFVGCVDPQYTLLQHNTGLYLMDTQRLSKELFYQVVLYRFGNFGRLKLEERADLTELLQLSSQYPAAPQGTAEGYAALLVSKSPMLDDYFSLGMRGGSLEWVPGIISDYTPQLEGIPNFLWALAGDTNWEDETKGLEDISRHVADFYSFKKRYCQETRSSGLEAGKKEWKWTVQNILYPAFKSKLFPPNEFSKNHAVLKLTDLHDLYKIFERC